MSVEAAPRALIWRSDITSSKRGRKVSQLRNVSTIHSVRKFRCLSEEKRDNAKPDAKASSKPKAVVPPGVVPVEQTKPPLSSATSSVQSASATQPRRTQQPTSTAETMRRREEDYYGYNQQEQSRPRSETNISLSSRGAEFESIRLAIRMHEWYRDRV
jgi:hypothetical protein